MSIALVPAEEMSSEKGEIDEDDIKKKFEYVINFFQQSNPNPTTELNHKDGYELLVATILSAQATDKRVNMITPALFEKFPTVDKLAKATPEEVYQYISSINYGNNKSNYIVRSANMIMSKYNGKVPEDPNELENLPGVGRKTAHVIAATLFNKPVLAVDTHVFRVAERIGLTTGAENPLDTEEQLLMYTPKDVISKMSHWLILHGRYICMAKGPLCTKCGVNKVCRYYEMNYTS